MFTGLVEDCGVIRGIRRRGEAATLEIESSVVAADLKIGDSVSVNGACLTVVEISGSRFSVDAVPETMRRTNLGLLAPGGRVNLERALKLGDRLGGHLVSGHVDATGVISRIMKDGIATIVTVRIPEDLARFVAPKGSVALDGISLTVVERSGREFTVSVIPHSLAATTLNEKHPGSVVNVEVDLVARYLENLLAEQRAGGRRDEDRDGERNRWESMLQGL